MVLVRLLHTLLFLPGNYHLSAGTSSNPSENNGIYPEIAVSVFNRFPFPFKRKRPVGFMPKAIIMCLVLLVMSSAKVFAVAAPTTRASAVSFTGTTVNSTSIGWTKGNGAFRAVFMFAGAAGPPPGPANNTTYTANTIFGSGTTQIGLTGWFCVYNGTGTGAGVVTVTGLNPVTTYRVMVVEYNTGTAPSPAYGSTTANASNPANVTTLSPTISYTGSPYTYNRTIAITTLTPTVTGTPTSYSINTALPTGINFSTVNGQISGTPTVTSTSTTYTITANYAGGITATTTIIITVIPPTLTVTCGTLSQVYGAVDVSSIPNLYTITGYVNGDTQATALSTLPSPITTPTASNSSGAGSYSITASGAVVSATASVAYAITYVPGNYTITPATLTVYATGPAKSYGVPITTGTYTAFFSATGLVNNESVTSLTLTPNNAGMDVPSNTAVGGAYTVTPSNVAGFTTSNYSISYVAYSGVCGNSYTWTGANGLTNTNWSNSGNWTSSTGGTFPGANDNATIPGGTLYSPTVNMVSQCNTLTFSGSNFLTIGAGLTFIVNQGLTVPTGVAAQITNASTSSVLQIGTTASGSLVTNSGYFHLTGGKLSIPSGANYISNSSTGTVQLDGGVTFNITGYGYTANNAIVNAGFFNAGVSGSPCYLIFDDSQSILNQNTGSFYLGPTSVMSYFNTAAHDCHVVNSPGGVFTLQSDVTGSASILAIPQNASNPNTYVGNFTVERYVTGNRAYRLLSSQVYSGTVSPNNVYDIRYLKNSAYLTGTNGAAGGFDKAGNPTLYLYRENNVPLYTTFLNSNFRGINNISTTPTYGMDDASYASANLPVGSGFLFFYRGNRNDPTYTMAQQFTPGTPAKPVVLSTTGKLNMGNVVVHDWYTPSSANLGWTTVSGSVNIEGFNLVGNPYPCSIDWDQTTSGGITTTAVAPFSYQLIPTGLQGAGNYNVYQAGTNIGGNKQGTQFTPNSNIIASGEGFFVQALSASAALTFKETAKSSTLNTGANLYMGTPPLASNNLPYMHLQLKLDSINTDGAIIRFNDNSKAAFDINEDAIYRSGSGVVSLSSLSSDNIPLAINQQPLSLKGQTIPINVNATSNGTYKLNVMEIKEIPQVLGVWLKDNLLKDSVNMRATNSYSFTITKTDSTTFGAKRFTLVIRQDTAYAYRLLTFGAKKVQDARAVRVAWTTRFEENYTNFTVEKSIDNGKTFNILGGLSASATGSYNLADAHPVNGINLYRLKQEDINSTITYSKIVPVAYSDQNSIVSRNNLNVFPNPAKADINLVVLNDLTNASGYNIMISNSMGFVMKKGTSGQPNWQASVSDLLPGTYLVKVYNNKDQSLVGTTKFVKL